MKRKSKVGITAEHVFYAILIGTSMIMLWRGVWGLLDTYLFPHNKTVSYSVSVIIGLLILSVTGRIVKKLT